jgi:hypothetical protein
MAKKRKKTNKKTARKAVKKKGLFSKDKFTLILRKFFVFLILFVVSFGLYSISVKEFWINLFVLSSLIFGVLSLTFLIIILISYFFKILK